MNEELKVIISAEVSKLKQGCQEAQNQVKGTTSQVEDSTKKMQESFKKVGTAIATYLSAKAIKDFASGCVEAYNTQLQAETKLQEIMTTRIGATQDEIRSVQALAAAQQGLGVVGDEVALAGAQQIATFATSTDTINTLLPAMENLAVQQNGVNVTSENMTSIANLMGKALQGQTGALTRVGISFTEAQEQVLKYGNEQERAAMLAQVITDNVGNMNEALAQTPEGQIAQLKNTLGDLKETLGSALAPVLEAIATNVSDFISGHQEDIDNFQQNTLPLIQEKLQGIWDVISGVVGFVVDNWGIVEPILAGVLAAILLVNTAVGVSNAITAIKTAMTVTDTAATAAGTVAQTGFAVAVNATMLPLTLIVVAIAAVVAIIVVCIKNWDKIKETVSDVISSIKEKIDGWWEKIKEVFGQVYDAISAPFIAVRDFISGVVEKIKGFFNFEWSLPKLKMPHVTIDGSFSLAPLRVPKFSIDWYANGGVFNSPTMFMNGGSLSGLGENGAEAVVPLENNLGWLDKLATMLGQRMGNGSPIILDLDGKVLAKGTINNINALTKQTGHLDLILE